jgi:SAM-dependent methyltransferase
MGFDCATIQILLTAREAGVSFDRVLTIGRQWLYSTREEVRAVMRRHGINLSATQAREIFTAQKGYCEPFLKLLGASRIDSIDASSYEGASILHDMNRPIPDTYRDQFNVVIDGGSLEHIFDFPTALKNCMQAVALGGHFIGITPSNNLMGHGFYQFSPELFFRVFTPANGFRIVKTIIYEYPWKSVWYEVVDPEQVKRRVELTNSRPAYLIVWAKKTESMPIFQQPPQQSDYLTMWQRSANPAIGDVSAQPGLLASLFKRYAPPRMARIYRIIRPFRSRLYKRVRVAGRGAFTGGEMSRSQSRGIGLEWPGKHS